MDAEVALLAQSAGTTLVALMATDAWHRARDGITQLWRRTQPERAETVAAELEAGREDVLAAAADDQQTLEELRLQWQGAVRRLLVARPAAVAQGPPEPAVAAVRVAPASVPSRRSTWSPASPGSRSPSSPRR